jgi:hypothetical protein
MDLDIYLSTAPWHKSSYSSGGGQNCVEVAVIPGSVAIRDSKVPSGPVHVVSLVAFGDLVSRIKRGDFDL